MSHPLPHSPPGAGLGFPTCSYRGAHALDEEVGDLGPSSITRNSFGPRQVTVYPLGLLLRAAWTNIIKLLMSPISLGFTL